MRTKGEHEIGFEGRSKHRYKFQFSLIEGDYDKQENHQFVVPWQLLETKENEFVFE